MSKSNAGSTLHNFALSDVAYIEMGQSPDSRYVVEDPFVGLSFLQGNAEFGSVYPEPKFGCLRPAKTCKANDVLISVRAPVGAVNLADRDYCIGRGLAAIRGRGINPTLLGEVVARQSSELRRVAQGTTFEAISKGDLLSLKLTLPPKAHWPQIAVILDTVDTAIHETEAIITKLKAIKQGLLHDLLTRGVDVNGELRPPQAEAPQLYTQSPLGLIPADWQVFELAQVAPKDRSVIRTGPFGSSLKGEHWRDSGRPVITIGSLGQTAFVLSELLYVDDATAARLGDFELIPGDVVFSRVADVGRSVVVSENERGWIMSSNFMRISVDSSKARPHFLQLLLSSSTMVRRLLRTTVNSAGRDVANSNVLMKLLFPWPTLTEQDEILRRAEAVNLRLLREEMGRQKLINTKVGLMDNLLTGRVRVAPLLNDEVHQAGSV